MSDADRQWGQRLKQARSMAGLSQKQLGIQAGIDEFVASTRINRYELGVHKPDFQTAQHLARVLKVSPAFLYAPEDDIAALLFRYGRATRQQKAAVRKLLEDLPIPEVTEAERLPVTGGDSAQRKQSSLERTSRPRRLNRSS